MLDIKQIPFLQNIFEAPYWSQVYFGNTLSEYAITAFSVIILLVVLKILQLGILYLLGGISKKTKNKLDDTLVQIVKKINPPFYTFLAFYIAVRGLLDFGAIASGVLDTLLIIWIVYQVVYSLQMLVTYFVKNHLVRENDAGAESMADMLGIIVKVVLWILGLAIVLANLGVDITTLVAGLGVAGIAVGLALQPVLSDLFASFSIYFDRPFQVGDFIGVDGDYGTVKYIGIKSTRLESYSGEQLVLANARLASSDIRNYSIRKRRHVVFTFGIDQETPLKKLRIISKNLRQMIEEEALVDEVERAWFNKFGDSAYVFEGAYYMAPPTYSKYLELQEKINFKLSEWLEKENIKLAYPTQMVYQYNIEGEEKK